MSSDETLLIASPSRHNYDVFVTQISSTLYNYVAEVVEQLMHRNGTSHRRGGDDHGGDDDNDDDQASSSQQRHGLRRAIRLFVRGIKRLEGAQRTQFLKEIQPYVASMELIYNPTMIYVAQSIFLHDTTGLRLSTSLIGLDEFTLMCVHEMVTNPVMNTAMMITWFDTKHPMAAISYQACLQFIQSIVQHCLIKVVFQYIRIAKEEDEDIFYGLNGMDAILKQEYHRQLFELFEPSLNNLGYRMDYAASSPNPRTLQTGYARDPYAPRTNDPYAPRTNDPYAPRTNDPYAPRTNDPYAPRTNDPYAPRTNDPYAPRTNDPYAPRTNDPFGRLGAQPRAGQNTNDPWMAPNATTTQDGYAGPKPWPMTNPRPTPYGLQPHPSWGANQRPAPPPWSLGYGYNDDALNRDRYDANRYRDDRRHHRRSSSSRHTSSRSKEKRDHKKHRRIKDSLSDFVSLDRSDSSRSESSKSRSY